MTLPMRSAMAVLLLIANGAPWSAQAAAAPTRRVTGTNPSCGDEAPQTAVLGCYLRAAATSRAEVERAFRMNEKSAVAFDAEANAFARLHHTPGSSLAKQLRAAQAEWLAYARHQCAYEGGTSFGGSGTDILEAACHYRLNTQRLAELKAAARLVNR